MREAAQRFLEDLRDHHGRPLRILDVGCGRRCALDYGDAYVVGVDTSFAALGQNNRLQERRLGDAAAAEFGNGYDLVVCWYVLEHVRNPELVLTRISRAVSHGGGLIVAVPNLRSVRGQVTKLTPHWFHLWWYRHMKSSRLAGQPGYGPFKTYMRRGIATARMTNLLTAEGFQVDATACGSITGSETRKPLLRISWQLTVQLVRLLTLGRFQERPDVLMLAQRQPRHSRLTRTEG